MSLRYLLPCIRCENQLEVVPKQAGQELECPKCQQRVEAPKLGKMKLLETVSETATAKKTSASGGSLRNLLFVIGLLLAIVCGASGYFVNQYAESLIYDVDFEAVEKQFDEDVDGLTAGQLVELYEQMNIEKGLGEWYEPNFVRYNTQGGYLKTFAYGLLGLSGLGVLALLGSFLIRR